MHHLTSVASSLTHCFSAPLNHHDGAGQPTSKTHWWRNRRVNSPAGPAPGLESARNRQTEAPPSTPEELAKRFALPKREEAVLRVLHDNIRSKTAAQQAGVMSRGVSRAVRKERLLQLNSHTSPVAQAPEEVRQAASLLLSGKGLHEQEIAHRASVTLRTVAEGRALIQNEVVPELAARMANQGEGAPRTGAASRQARMAWLAQRYQHERQRPVDREAAVEMITLRERARTMPKARLARLGQWLRCGVGRQTRTDLYNEAQASQQRAMGVGPQALHESRKGWSKSGKVEGIHTAVSRSVGLVASGVGFGVGGIVLSIVLKELALLGLNPPVSGGLRIISETMQILLRRDGAPKLAANIKDAKKMAHVRRDIQSALRRVHHTEINTSSDQNLNESIQRLYESVHALEQAEHAYPVRAGSAKLQTYGKAYGFAVNAIGVAGIISTPVSGPIGMGIAGGSIVAQWFAGLRDETNKHVYTLRANTKYANVLRTSALLKPPEEITAEDIDEAKLRSLWQGPLSARVELIQDVYRHALGKLVAGRDEAQTEQQRAGVDAELHVLLREVDLFETRQWGQLDPAGLLGRCVLDDMFLLRRGIPARLRKPGEFAAQTMQRFAQNFQMPSSLALGIIAADLESGITDVRPKPGNDTFISGTVTQTVGGAVFVGSTGAVRDHKNTDRVKFAPDGGTGGRIARERASLEAMGFRLPKQQRRLDQLTEHENAINARWMLNTPGGRVIDLRGTRAAHNRVTPWRTRAWRVLKALPASASSMPRGAVSTLRARSARSAAKTTLRHARERLQELRNLAGRQ